MHPFWALWHGVLPGNGNSGFKTKSKLSSSLAKSTQGSGIAQAKLVHLTLLDLDPTGPTVPESARSNNELGGSVLPHTKT